MTAAWRQNAGLIAAPLAWALVTQLSQILPYADCGARLPSSFLAAGAGGLVALAGAALSFQSVAGASDPTPRFVGRMNGGIALAFAFALLLQTLATTIVDPCQR
jgi:hypothetical protein